MTRRDNGLPGTDWRQVAEVEPPLADALLAALRDEGIAAFAAPTTGSTGAIIETTGHPGAKDRLYVTAAELDRANALVDTLINAMGAPAAPPSDEDVWAGIVAAYSAPPAQPVRPNDEPEDPLPTPPGPVGGFEEIRSELDARRSAAERPEPELDPTEHYLPPPPPPIPAGSVLTRTAWVGVLGGPLFLILATLLGWDASGVVGLIAVFAFIAGFITLVVHRSDDPPGDDGAVV